MRTLFRASCLALALCLLCPAGLARGAGRDCADDRAAASHNAAPAPGDILGPKTAERRQAFADPWRYRANTYEIYFDDPAELARSVYSLALHARDIDESLPVETFVRGVLGCHYSVEQVCAWLNGDDRSAAGEHRKLSREEARLVWMLLRDGALALKDGRFAPSGPIRHVLAASAGKKRSFADTLLHERLHIFWDEDEAFRARLQGQWQAMSTTEKAVAKQSLGRYASDNEAQLIEEWAIAKAEREGMDLR
jgi:hypothetical protein